MESFVKNSLLLFCENKQSKPDKTNIDANLPDMVAIIGTPDTAFQIEHKRNALYILKLLSSHATSALFPEI